jgi:predicted TIM-barrel fold metal-dependent hydrolase
LGDPFFNELLAELDRRSAVAFVHPVSPPGATVAKLDLPIFLVEFIFDTTRAVANLLFSGAFDRFSKIRFIFAHAGGAAPYLAHRWSLGEFVRPGLNGQVQNGVIATLKRIYYDTALAAAPSTLRGLQELSDPTHVLFGSDYPIAPEPILARSIAGLQSYNGFNKAGLKRVERENAVSLFPRLAGK